MASFKRFKRHEREIAKALGGMRLPNNGYGQPDVIAGNLAVQVKVRGSLPGWLTDAVDQSIRDAEWATEQQGQDMVPVVVLSHGVQGVKARRLAVIDLDHLTAVLDTEPDNDDNPYAGALPGCDCGCGGDTLDWSRLP